MDVSNIMDPNYAGVAAVVDAWGPLLETKSEATMLGYFMNWPGPRFYTGPSDSESQRIIARMKELGRVSWNI